MTIPFISRLSQETFDGLVAFSVITSSAHPVPSATDSPGCWSSTLGLGLLHTVLPAVPSPIAVMLLVQTALSALPAATDMAASFTTAAWRGASGFLAVTLNPAVSLNPALALRFQQQQQQQEK